VTGVGYNPGSGVCMKVCMGIHISIIGNGLTMVQMHAKVHAMFVRMHEEYEDCADVVKSTGIGKPMGFAWVKHRVWVWVAKFGPSPNPYPWAGSQVFSINIYHFVNNNGKILQKFTKICPYVAVT
jgi:hypothetical protein